MRNTLICIFAGGIVTAALYYNYRKKHPKVKVMEANVEQPDPENTYEQQKTLDELRSENEALKSEISRLTATNTNTLAYYENESRQFIQHYHNDSYRVVNRSMIKSLVQCLYDAWEELSENVNYDAEDFKFSLAETYGYNDAELALLIEDCDLYES